MATPSSPFTPSPNITNIRPIKVTPGGSINITRDADEVQVLNQEEQCVIFSLADEVITDEIDLNTLSLQTKHSDSDESLIGFLDSSSTLLSEDIYDRFVKSQRKVSVGVSMKKYESITDSNIRATLSPIFIFSECPALVIKNKSFREFWRDVIEVDSVRFDFFVQLLEKYFSERDGIRSNKIPMSDGNFDQSFVQSIRSALDVGSFGIISALQLNIATNYLPTDFSISQCLLSLKLHARLILLPGNTQKIFADVSSLVENESECDDLINFITPYLFAPKDYGNKKKWDNVSIEDNESEREIISENIVLWKVVIGPENIGKSSRLLRICANIANITDLSIQERLPSILKSVPVVVFDVRGASCYYSLVSTMAAQLGLASDNFLGVETKLEHFFFTLKSKGSLIIFDHVLSTDCAGSLKTFFETLQFSNLTHLNDETEDSLKKLCSYDSTVELSDVPMLFEVVVVSDCKISLAAVFSPTKNDSRKDSLPSPTIQFSKYFYMPLVPKAECVASAALFMQSALSPSVHSSENPNLNPNFNSDLSERSYEGSSNSEDNIETVSRSNAPAPAPALTVELVADTLLGTFGGVCGDIKAVCNIKNAIHKESFSSLLHQFATDSKAPIDPKIAIEAIMIESICKHYNEDTAILARCLSPIQIASCKSSQEPSKFEFVCIPFDINIAWYLSNEFLADTVTEKSSTDKSAANEPSERSKRFLDAWSNLIEIGWVRPHLHSSLTDMYYISANHICDPIGYFKSEPASGIFFVSIDNQVAKYMAYWTQLLVEYSTTLKELSFSRWAFTDRLETTSPPTVSHHPVRQTSQFTSKLAIISNLLHLSAGHISFYLQELEFMNNENPQTDCTDLNKLSADTSILGVLETHYENLTVRFTDNKIPFRLSHPRQKYVKMQRRVVENIVSTIAGRIDPLCGVILPVHHSLRLCLVSLQLSAPRDAVCKPIILRSKVLNPTENENFIATESYVSALNDYGMILCRMQRFKDAENVLGVALEISQQMSELDYAVGTFNSLPLIKTLLNLSTVIEKHFVDVDLSPFNDELSTTALQLGVWTDTALLAEGKQAMSNEVLRYYSDGDSLRKQQYGFSRHRQISPMDEVASIRKDREKAKSFLEQALFHFEVQLKTAGPDVVMEGDGAYIYVSILNDLAVLEQLFENFSKAKKYFDDSLRWRRFFFGSYHPLAAEGMKSLALALQLNGNHEDALLLYTTALSVLVSIFKWPNLTISSLVSCIASCLRAMGREDDAITYLRYTLKFQQKSCKPCHPAIVLTSVRLACTMAATTIDRDPSVRSSIISCFGSRNFAISLRPRDIFTKEFYKIAIFDEESELKNEAFKKALKIIGAAIQLVKSRVNIMESSDFWRVLRIRIGLPIASDSPGDDEFDVAVSSSDRLQLANISLAQAAIFSCINEFSDAANNLLDSLEVVKRLSGDPDSSVADILLALGEQYRRAATYGQYGHASNISYQSRFGILDSYENEIKKQSYLKDALEAFRDALDIYRNVFDDEHPTVMATMRCIAHVHREQGKYKTARAVFEKILDTYRDIRIGETIELAETYLGFAHVLCLNGGQEEALTIIEQARSLYRKLNGFEHITVAICTRLLANAYFDLESYDEALPLFNEALTSFRKLGQALTPLHSAGDGEAVREPSVVGDILNCMGSIKQSKKLFEESRTHYSEALGIYMSVFGEVHPTVAKTLNNLATLMDDHGNLDEAKALYEYALTILRQFYGEVHPLVLVAMENLAAMLEAQGQHEESEAIYEQVDDIRERLDEIEATAPKIEEEIPVSNDSGRFDAFVKGVCVIF